jgi:hypothetical protein
MTRRHRLASGAVAASLAIGLTLHAAEPVRWEVSTATQWLRGRGDQVAIDRDGRITLGPILAELHEDTAPTIWDVTVAPDGRVYMGTGNDGRVITFDGKTARTLLDVDEIQVHAVAWHRDALLAASSPDGKVYRVEADGSSRVFFDPDDSYIWALLVADDGRVYVGTGSKARVYEVSADGRTHTAIFEAPAANVTALALDSEGRLLVGTDNPGRLYRVPRGGGRAFALMDGPHTQVQAIRPTADGGAYVLAVSPSGGSNGTPTPAPASRAPTPVVTTEVSIVAVGDNVVSASTQSAPPAASDVTASKGKGVVYRLGADGLSEVFWDVTSELPYDIAIDGDDRLLVAAEAGAIYRLDGSPLRVSRLAQASAQHVTRIVRDGERYLLAAANPGKLFALDARTAATGTYTSDVRDAGAGARWGLLRWDGQVPGASKTSFETRSGNTAAPDDTWDTWTALKTDGSVARVQSPPARYLQWRVALTAGRDGRAPVLDAVTVTYLGRNQRPRISSLTVHPPGVVFQQPFGTQEPPELAGFSSATPAPARDQAIAAATPGNSGAGIGRRLYQKGFQTLQWDAQDPDGDDLRYRVLVRRVGTDAWRVLARDLTGTVFTWDTSQLADGRYYVRVVASDGRANPADVALEGEREQGPITVDNTPPIIHLTAPADRKQLRFTVTDAVSPLARVDVLLPDGSWRPVFPEDGVMDGLEERFAIPREELGEGVVVLRATDAQANLTTLEVPALPASR